MSRTVRTLLAIVVVVSLHSCGGSAVSAAFTDSAGRAVQIPTGIKRVAPSGTVATMILATLAPELMVSLSSPPTGAHYQYLPDILTRLPDTGQLYGTKGTLNLEAVMSTGAQLIIDMGDPKDGIASDLDSLQRQIGIPCIYIRADLNHMAGAYRTLGRLLGKEAKAEAIAALIDETVLLAKRNSARIPDGERVSVMFGTGPTGLNANARGSIHAQVIELVGAENAVMAKNVNHKGGGNTINMEQLYMFNPDVILLAPGGPFDLLRSDRAWSELAAVKNGTFYEIPGAPYNWLAGPPSVNMVLGVWWLGNLLYPQVYDYDMASVAQRIFKLFWDYDLTREEAAAMLGRSTGKVLKRSM